MFRYLVDPEGLSGLFWTSQSDQRVPILASCLCSYQMHNVLNVMEEVVHSKTEFEWFKS